ncbi:unnamed protein product [Gordionus sp. m RMFG-2023]
MFVADSAKALIPLFNWTEDALNRTNNSLVPVTNVYLKYEIFLLLLQGMLSGHFSLACLIKIKKTIFHHFLVQLRHMNLTISCINFIFFALWVFKGLKNAPSQNPLAIHDSFIYGAYIIEFLSRALSVFEILLILAQSLESYMIGCLHRYRVYWVVGNVKYLTTILISLSAIITFPIHRNYLQVSSELVNFRHNITGQSNISDLFSLFKVNGGKGYKKFEMYREALFQAILIAIMIFIRIRHNWEIKKFAGSQDITTLCRLINEIKCNRTLFQWLISFQISALLPRFYLYLMMYFKSPWISHNKDTLLWISVPEVFYSSASFYIYVIFAHRVKDMFLKVFNRFIWNANTVSPLSLIYQ